MKMTGRFSVMLLICLLTGGGSRGQRSVTLGHNVTLMCTYDVRVNGRRSVCWGRGRLPMSGCSDQLVATDGHRVKEETRVSGRYRLLGRLEDGDVSLTIVDATEGDAGWYGCRVDIPGWWNDQKHHVKLDVAPQTTTSPVNMSADGSTAPDVTVHMSSTESHMNSSSVSIEPEESSSRTAVLAWVLLGLIVAITAVGATIIARRRSRLLKTPQQQNFDTLLRFSSTSSSLQLHSRSSAVDNIYQMDGDEYEYCP